MIRLMQMGQQRPKTPATDLAALTRQQREADRRLAQAVQPRRIEHWTQGANQIAQSALAGMDRRRLREKEEFTAKQGAELMTGLLGAGAGANPANLKAALLNPHTRDLAMKMMMQRQAQARAASQPSEMDRKQAYLEKYGQGLTPAQRNQYLFGIKAGEASQPKLIEQDGVYYERTAEGLRRVPIIGAEGQPTAQPEPSAENAAPSQQPQQAQQGANTFEIKPGQPGYNEYKETRGREMAKARVKLEQSIPKLERAIGSYRDKITNVMDSISKARAFLRGQSPLDRLKTGGDPKKDKFNSFTYGAYGGWMGMLPGTTPYTLQRMLDPIKAVIGFNELKEMREGSASGASGLGQVTERELNFLQSVISSLDLGVNDPRIIDQALVKVQKTLQGSADRMQAAFERDRARVGLGPESVPNDRPPPTGRPGFGVGEGQTMDLGNGITARRVR
jgi:hypothetical protein